MLSNRSIIILLGFLSLLIFLQLPGSDLFEPDEARYAEVPREMLVAHDFITPRQNGALYLEKPPLLYWCNAASIAVLGENSFAARLPVRLAALATIFFLLFGLEWGRWSEWGNWSALIFISSPLPFVLSRLNITDGVLSAALTLTFLSMRRWIQLKRDEQSAAGVEVLLGLAMALAVLAKGIIGLLFPGAILFLYLLLTRNLKFFPRMIVSWATPVFLLVAAPWFVLEARRVPDFAWFFFVHEHLQRFTTDQAKRTAPAYFFIVTLLLGFFPWTLFIVSPCKKVWEAVTSRFKKNQDELFFALWIGFIVAFFSASQSKLIPYILPVFPALAALLAKEFVDRRVSVGTPLLVNALLCTLMLPLGAWLGSRKPIGNLEDPTFLLSTVAGVLILSGWVAYRRERVTALVAGWMLVYFCAVLALPQVASDYSSRSFAQAIRSEQAEAIGYRCYPESLTWFLKQNVPVVDFKGELASVGPRDPEIFWDEQKFWLAWNSGRRIAAVVRRGDMDKFHEPGVKAAEVADNNRRYRLLFNFRARSGLKS